jgi:predicted molibdopterin-dependent oxidoreductase YjgC
LTGKLWKQKGRLSGAREVDTTCPYCGTGCHITAHVAHNEIVKITSKPYTWNEGWLCVKGRFGYRYVNSPDRLTKPLIRIAQRNNSSSGSNGSDSLFREASWDEALDYVAARLKEIKANSGPDAIGGLSSARCTNEENYAFQKFIRAGVGTNNVDHCARL